MCAACAGPVTRLPPLPQDAVEAERRRQQIAQIQDYFAQLRRVDTVAFRIRTANRADCKQWVSAQIGLHAVTPQSLPRKYRSFSAEALNLTWARPTVISVVDGSPAAQAGIVDGDQITALDGELVPVTGTAGWIGGWLKRNGETPVRVDLRRDGIDRTVAVQPVISCAIPIILRTEPSLNAFTDGSKIVIYSSMLRVARTDSELAVIIGHELAHANLGHTGKKKVNALIGAVGGALVDGGFMLGGIYTGGTFSKHFETAGAQAYSIAFEREADYVGAYYAARAGYDVSGAEQIWWAMGQELPDSIRFAKTHPTTPERFVQMQKVVEEIADKKRRNLPLMPELKVMHADAQHATASGEVIQ
jgi:Zn-dependent protease with chaperone function